MPNDGVADTMRTVLNDYKHNRIGLGDAMRRLKQILYQTNENYYNRGNIMGRYVKRGSKERSENCFSTINEHNSPPNE